MKFAKALYQPSSKLAEKTFFRDENKCVVCGQGKINGLKLYATYIRPLKSGGLKKLINCQTLCENHIIGKNQSEAILDEKVKNMFVTLNQLAKSENNEVLINFSKDILQTFEDHHINGHIEWKK